MATATTPPITSAITPPLVEDIVQRHLKRALPCRLDRDELTDIAIAAAKKRRHLRELEADLDAEKKRRKQQIDELQREIDTHDRELDTEEQERVVLCDLIFRAGMVFVRRRDTSEEIEPRPATAQEAQRFLPAIENTLPLGPNAPLLDQAAAAQGRATISHGGAESAELLPPDEGDGEPYEPDEDDDQDDEPEPDDDGLSEPAPAGKAKGKRGRGGKGKAK